MPDNIFEKQIFTPNKKALLAWLEAPSTTVETAWYLNPYTLGLIEQGDLPVCKGDRFVSDGGLMTNALSQICGLPCESLHFDFSGCSGDVFGYAEANVTRIGIIGGTASDITNFLQRIRMRFPRINIVFEQKGYFDPNEIPTILQHLDNSGAEIVVISMGSPRQEVFAAKIKEFSGVPKKIITSGAFISQVAERGEDYYPPILVSLGLRWVYRIIRDRRILLRVYRYYLPFLWKWRVLGKISPVLSTKSGLNSDEI